MNRRIFTQKLIKISLVVPSLLNTGIVYPHQNSRPTLHVFLAIDFSEPNRQSDRQNDMSAISQFFQDKGSRAGMTVRMYELTRANFSPQAVTNAINSVSLSPNSGIVVYFSGHGANLDNSQYPTLSFGNAGSLRMQALADTVQARRPRLCFVMADCCNNLAFRTPVIVSKTPPINNDLLRQLFWDFGPSFRGVGKKVMICAAEKGDVSISNNQGSIFQYALRRAFEELIQREGQQPNLFWLNLENLTQVHLSNFLTNHKTSKNQIYQQSPRISVSDY